MGKLYRASPSCMQIEMAIINSHFSNIILINEVIENIDSKRGEEIKWFNAFFLGLIDERNKK